MTLFKPRRFVIAPYVREIATGGILFRYPLCTATPEGYTFLAPARITRLSVSAVLANFTNTDTFQVGLYKDSFTTAFMEVTVDAGSGDYYAVDSTTVTEFNTTEQLLPRIMVESGIASDITVVIDGEWLT